MDTAQVPHQYEHTAYIPSKNAVVHYTCNAPSDDVLGKYGIVPLEGLNGGESMFMIPADVFRKFGYRIGQHTDKNVLKITAENLLAKL